MKYLARLAFVLSVTIPVVSPAEPILRVPPVTTTLQIADQPVVVTVSGTVQEVSGGDGGGAIRLNLDADLADLQRQITSILRAQLNQDNRCGERLSVDQATLNPDAPASLLTANVHFEKWGCAKAFGKEIVKKLIGGNGVIRMRLTPMIENGDSVQLRGEVLSIDADRQFGEALQEKIRKTIVSAVDKLGKLTESLPPAIRSVAVLRSVRFSDSGEGHLSLNLTADAQLSAEQAKDLLKK